MKNANTGKEVRIEPTVDAGRRSVLGGMLALGSALALGGCSTAMQPGAGTGGSARLAGGRFSAGCSGR